MAMIIPMQWKRAHPAPCPQARLFLKSVSVKPKGVHGYGIGLTDLLCVPRPAARGEAIVTTETVLYRQSNIDRVIEFATLTCQYSDTRFTTVLAS